MSAPTTEATPTMPAAKGPFGGLKLNPTALRAYTMVLALIAIWIFFYYKTGGVFLEARNFSNLIRATAVTGVLACGMLLIIVAGHIDLSVGSLVGLCGAAAAGMMTWMGYGLLPSIATAITVGLVVGLAHGTLVAYLNVPAFIVTLGGLLAWRGAVKGLTSGETIPIDSAGFKSLGQGYVSPTVGYIMAGIAVAIVAFFAWRNLSAAKQTAGKPSSSSLPLTAAKYGLFILLILGFTYILNSYRGVPVPVLVLVVVAVLTAFFSQATTFGRYLYAIGGNVDAARLSGINIRRQILLVFGLMGVLTAVASLIYTARVGSASPAAGVLLELDAIAACVIGGASLMGGRGTVMGALLGALFMASLDNGMSLQNVQDYLQDIIKGSVLVLAVTIDMLGRKKQ